MVLIHNFSDHFRPLNVTRWISFRVAIGNLWTLQMRVAIWWLQVKLYKMWILTRQGRFANSALGAQKRRESMTECWYCGILRISVVESGCRTRLMQCGAGSDFTKCIHHTAAEHDHLFTNLRHCELFKKWTNFTCYGVWSFLNSQAPDSLRVKCKDWIRGACTNRSPILRATHTQPTHDSWLVTVHCCRDSGLLPAEHEKQKQANCVSKWRDCTSPLVANSTNDH